MLNFQKIVILYLIAINSVAYATMCFDKYQSKKNGNRISENKLFLLSLFFGSVGVYSGMKYPVFHKSTKRKFKIGIPILLLVQCLVVVYFISKNVKVFGLI